MGKSTSHAWDCELLASTIWKLLCSVSIFSSFQTLREPSCSNDPRKNILWSSILMAGQIWVISASSSCAKFMVKFFLNGIYCKSEIYKIICVISFLEELLLQEKIQKSELKASVNCGYSNFQMCSKMLSISLDMIKARSISLIRIDWIGNLLGIWPSPWWAAYREGSKELCKKDLCKKLMRLTDRAWGWESSWDLWKMSLNSE